MSNSFTRALTQQLEAQTIDQLKHTMDEREAIWSIVEEENKKLRELLALAKGIMVMNEKYIPSDMYYLYESHWLKQYAEVKEKEGKAK